MADVCLEILRNCKDKQDLEIEAIKAADEIERIESENEALRQAYADACGLLQTAASCSFKAVQDFKSIVVDHLVSQGSGER